jgi:hypothetical protein
MKLSTKSFVVSAAAAALAFWAVTAAGTVAPGTPGKDVTTGLDSDNASNAFIQPPGVVAPQHMNNTDVLFGRGNDDLLIGNLGNDVPVGGGGDDILVGGPEHGVSPNSDVLLGDGGDDVNIWAPGDGSDAYVGDRGYDTMIFAPFVTRPNGSLKLEWFHGRKVPRVEITNQPEFSCQIVKVPPSQQMGEQFLVRFEVNDVIVATVRQRDVERLLCPSLYGNRAVVADLTRAHPTFHQIRLVAIPGVVGAIVAKP